MADIIPLKRRVCETDEGPPAITGAALCIACKHEWTAALEIKDGAFDGFVEALECPACGCNRGQFRWPFMGPEAEEVWSCKCGGQLFMITKQGTRCVGCGLHQAFNG